MGQDCADRDSEGHSNAPLAARGRLELDAGGVNCAANRILTSAAPLLLSENAHKRTAGGQFARPGKWGPVSWEGLGRPASEFRKAARWRGFGPSLHPIGAVNWGSQLGQSGSCPILNRGPILDGETRAGSELILAARGLQGECDPSGHSAHSHVVVRSARCEPALPRSKAIFEARRLPFTRFLACSVER